LRANIEIVVIGFHITQRNLFPRIGKIEIQDALVIGTRVGVFRGELDELVKGGVANQRTMKKHNRGLEVIGTPIPRTNTNIIGELVFQSPLVAGIGVRMSHQFAGFLGCQDGRNGRINLGPAIHIENVVPLPEERRENMELVVLEQFESTLAARGVRFLYGREGFGGKNDVGAMAHLDLVGVLHDEWVRVHSGQIVAYNEHNGSAIIADFNEAAASGDELIQVAEVTDEYDGNRHLENLLGLRLYLYAANI